LEQWRSLLAVVDAGGYAQAAGALHKSQSSVTYAVQKIEAAVCQYDALPAAAPFSYSLAQSGTRKDFLCTVGHQKYRSGYYSVSS